MRGIIFIPLFLFSVTAYSQSSEERFLDSTIAELKIQHKVDKNDQRIFMLLESFYSEVLQADKGNLSPQMVQKIGTYMKDNEVKNRHLLILFLMYQDHISETAAQGKRTNKAYQVACINLLEKEMSEVYGKLPTIVYIYKSEALRSAGRNEEARAVVEAGLKNSPASIPLKVYKYLDLKDEAIKNDLVKNHSGHWMVQQFGIK